MIIDFSNENWGENPCEYIEGKLDSIADPDKLYQSYKKASKPIYYKASTQRYGLNLLSNIAIANEALNNGSYKIGDPYEFILTERGRIRYVKALYITSFSFLCFITLWNHRLFNRRIYSN